jgi:hypothetical protein
LTLAGLPAGVAQQSDKVDIGALRAERYACFGCVDFTLETPTTGTIDYYWAPSTNATQANGNVGGNSGADNICVDGGLGGITALEIVKWCDYIGSLTVHNGACVQNGFIGVFTPPTRYGQLIVFNNSDDSFETDDVEMHQVLNPIVDEVQ